MAKVISASEAAAIVKDGMTVMVGGFLSVGSPLTIIDELIKQNRKNLTLISNDTSFVDSGVGKMVVNKQFKKIITSHIGTNKESGNQMNAGETEIVLVPQGSLVEKIRHGGAGLGGFYTPTGAGTDVAIGKEAKTIDGKEYIFEEALHAEIALIRGSIVDKAGNVYYKGTTRNFNPPMATAADIVIVEAEKLVEKGEIDPNIVVTPGLFVDYIVVAE